MDNKFDEIRKGLSDGKKPTALIKEGYPKSSVYAVAKTLRGSQLSAVEAPGADAPDDELVGLRRKKEVVKLEIEIADIEDARDKLPRRIAVLEAREALFEEVVMKLGKETVALRQDLRKAVDNALMLSVEWVQRLALYQQYPVAKDWCDGWVEREIEPKIEDGT